MAKRYVVRLSAEERTRLVEVVHRKRVGAQKRTRAEVLLKADAGPEGPGWVDTRIAEAFDVSVVMVENLRKRLVLEGFEAALERKPQCRPSRPRLLDGKQEARLVSLCCGTVPAGHGRWTLRLLAEELVRLEVVDHVSHETVRQTLKKTTCSPGVG